MKDAGLEVMRNTSSVGETKVVVQKWSNNVAQLSKDVQKQVRQNCLIFVSLKFCKVYPPTITKVCKVKVA